MKIFVEACVAILSSTSNVHFTLEGQCNYIKAMHKNNYCLATAFCRTLFGQFTLQLGVQYLNKPTLVSVLFSAPLTCAQKYVEAGFCALLQKTYYVNQCFFMLWNAY